MTYRFYHETRLSDGVTRRVLGKVEAPDATIAAQAIRQQYGDGAIEVRSAGE